MSLKSVAVGLLMCLSLLLGVVACGLAWAGLQDRPPDGQADPAQVRISGIGNSGNTFYVSSARRTARLANEMRVAEQISNEQLEQAVKAVLARANQGDPDAAAFVFELAAAQRQKERATPK